MARRSVMDTTDDRRRVISSDRWSRRRELDCTKATLVAENSIKLAEYSRNDKKDDRMDSEHNLRVFPQTVTNTNSHTMTFKDGEEIPPGSTALRGGLDLRDYFAAQAMQSLISNGDLEIDRGAVARIAYLMADAMLVVRQERDAA